MRKRALAAWERDGLQGLTTNPVESAGVTAELALALRAQEGRQPFPAPWTLTRSIKHPNLGNVKARLQPRVSSMVTCWRVK